MTVNVAVLPLLHGDVEIKNFTLDEPRINLHVAANGAENWAFAPAQKIPPAAAAVEKEYSSPMGALENLSVGGVSIKDGSVTFVNDQTKQRQAVQKLDADMSMGGLAEPVSVNGSGEWNGKMVKIKAELGSLRELLSRRADLSADIESDTLSFHLKGALAGQIFTGKATVTSPSLKDALAWLNPASKPLPTSARLALNVSSDVICSPHACDAANADMSLDAIKAKGNVKASWEGTPDIAVNLVMNTLDFNPFLAPERQAALPSLVADAVAAGAPWSSAPMDFSGLRSVNATAVIVTDGILWRKIAIGKTTLRAALQQGRLTANVADAPMYGGTGSASITLDAGASSLESRAALKGIQIKPLMEDAAGLSRLSGSGDVDFTVNGHGSSQRDMVSSLAGNGKFGLTNGQISGVNLTNLLHNVIGGAGGGNTPIQAMNGTFTIAQGLVSNHDLMMKMPDMQVSGQGTINLPSYVIDYRLTPQVVRAAGAGNASGAGVSVPVLIQGSLDNPRFAPDVGSVLQNALKNPTAFRQELKNTGGSLKDQLKGLKGLLGQ
ncbi:MAG: AsmA family protein, partial [Pseudomonadota bacterium]|nr:AsmA family protein [Pseudomonadota bacterium]